MLVTRRPSLPGRPETNSLIERQVQVVARRDRALLIETGMLLAFSSGAVNAYCHLRIIQQNEFGNSVWSLRFKKLPRQVVYTELNVPYGSYMAYYPPPTTADVKERTKFAECIVPGILLIYNMFPRRKVEAAFRCCSAQVLR